MRHNLLAGAMVPVLRGHVCRAQPPSYNKDLNKRYPLLYLRHGMSEDRCAWANQGRANSILDNLIAEGKAKPNIWNLREALAKAGIKSAYYESPDTAHEWLTRRRHLREFAPRLFKD
jgi:enterochelin esterase-like enzyme